jgi:hypothetical protein
MKECYGKKMGRNLALYGDWIFTNADRLGLLAVRYERWHSGKTALSLTMP